MSVVSMRELLEAELEHEGLNLAPGARELLVRVAELRLQSEIVVDAAEQRFEVGARFKV